MAEMEWGVSVSGETGNNAGDKLYIVRHGDPKIVLELDVPGLRTAGADQSRQGREAIQAAIDALQDALDSPTALAGFRAQ